MTFAHLRVGGVVGGTGTMTLMFLGWIWSRRARPDTAYLFDVPSAVPQFPVDAIFTVNGHVIGTDAGAVSFLGSRICFEGRLTSFDIDRSDLEAAPDWSARRNSKRRAQAGMKLLLNYRLGVGSCSVMLKPYDQVDGVGKGFYSRFLEAATEWRASVTWPVSQSTLPPRVPLPTQVLNYEAWIRGCAIAALTGLLGLAICLGFIQRSPWFGSASIVCGAVVLMAISAAAVQRSELMACRRLLKP